jgi:hypothetical protein
MATVTVRQATTLTMMMATTRRATTSTEVGDDSDGAKQSSPSMVQEGGTLLCQI